MPCLHPAAPCKLREPSAFRSPLVFPSGDALRLRSLTGARAAESAWVEASFDRRTVTDADRIRRGAARRCKTMAA